MKQMRIVFLLMAVLISAVTNGQIMQQNNTPGGYQWKAGKFDSLLIAHRGSDTPNVTNTKYGVPTVGALFVQTIGSDSAVLWQRTSTKWIKVANFSGGGGSGGITELTGDVVAGPGSGSQVATIQPNVVDYSKFQQLPGTSLFGRNTNTTGNGNAITGSIPNTVPLYNGATLGFAKVPFAATTGLVPDTRTININGVTQDLLADRQWRAGLSNTGALTYAGISVASGTTVNIGAVTGIITDNETTPGTPSYQLVSYAGGTGITVPTIATGTGTYVLLNNAGSIVFQNTYPTSAQRKSMIYLSKISHPNLTSISFALDEVDFVTSPLQQFRDLFQVIQYMNQGVIASGNAGLTINTTSGTILGDGINFVADRTNPNNITVAAGAPRNFLLLNQSGAAGGFVTTIDPTTYDVGGTTTPIGGGTNRSTIQYLYFAPGVGFAILRGQTIYANLTEAIAAVGRESFVVRPNLVNNSILIAAIVLRHTTTNMNDANFVRILAADKFGQIGGAASGIPVSTLQTAYNNSVIPQITTNSTLDGVTIRQGSGSDADAILKGQNGSAVDSFRLNGNGQITLGTWKANPVTYQYGGIGLNSLGTAWQSIRVNSVLTGYEFYTPPAPDTRLTVYSKKVFQSTSDFTQSGSPTLSVTADSALSLSGGTGTFGKYIYLTGYQNTDENNIIEAVFKNTVSGFGLSIGKNSINSWYNASIAGHADMSAANIVLKFWDPATTTNITLKNTSIPATAGSIYRLTYTQAGIDFKLKIENITSGGVDSITLTNNLGTAKNFKAPNSSNITIWANGGTQQIQSLNVYSIMRYQPDVVVIGDSKTFGYSAAGAISLRYASQLGTLGLVNVYGGDGDRTVETVQTIATVAARRPKYAILCIGRNDLASGVSSGTWQANYQTIVNTLSAAGTTVIHLLPIPETTQDQSALKTWITANYTRTIDPSVGWVNGNYLSSDNIHPNAAGHAFVATTILNAKLIPITNNVNFGSESAYAYSKHSHPISDIVGLSGSGGTPAGGTGQIQYNNAGSFGASSNLFWDATNTRLGVGTSSPSNKVGVTFNLNSDDGITLTNQSSGSSATSTFKALNDLGENGLFATYSSTAPLGLANNAGVGGSRNLILVSNNLVGAGGNYGIQFRTGGANPSQERMRISATGPILINTTSDSTSGRLIVSGDLSLNTAGNKIKIATGSNASVGVSAAMTAGTITISTTAVTASSKIFLTHATVGGTPGVLSVGTITAGTSFVINSSSGSDTSTVNWWIVN